MNGTIARGLLCAAVLLSIPAFAVSGQSVWEGSAAVSRYGELPSTGYFGASNTFPLNSLVTVTESAGGRSVTVFIISTLSEPGIFLLLSPQAAQELGVEKGALVPVKAAATRPGAQTAGPVSIPEPEGPDLDSPPARGSSGAAAVAPKKEGRALLDEILEELRASSRTERDPVPAAIPLDTPEPFPPAVRIEPSGPAPELAFELPAPSGPVLPSVEADDVSDTAAVAETDAAEVAVAAPELPEELYDELPELLGPSEPPVSIPEPLAAAEPEIPIEPEPIDSLSVPAPSTGIASSEPVMPEMPEIPEFPGTLIAAETGTVEEPETPELSTVPPFRSPPALPGTDSVELSSVSVPDSPLPDAMLPPAGSPGDGDIEISLVPAEPRPPVPAEAAAAPDPAGRTAPSSILVPPSRISSRSEADQSAAPAQAPSDPEPAEPIPETIASTEPDSEADPAAEELPEIVLLADPRPQESPADKGVPQPDLSSLMEPSRKDVPDTKPETAPGTGTGKPAGIAETAPVATAAVPAAAAMPGSVLPEIAKLESGSYYLQLGAYSSRESAGRMVSSLPPGYPVAVQPASSGDRTTFRLLIGPILEDESGMMLYFFRARGFRDAYIRRGE